MMNDCFHHAYSFRLPQKKDIHSPDVLALNANAEVV